MEGVEVDKTDRKIVRSGRKLRAGLVF